MLSTTPASLTACCLIAAAVRCAAFLHTQVSEEVSDDAKAEKLWELSEKLVGLA